MGRQRHTTTSPFEEADPAEDRRFVTALARGLTLLRCFSPSDRWLAHQELARRAGLPQATVSRLTYTLTSLGYLRRFPLDILKIDRSFVRDADRDCDSAAIVHTVVALARVLKLTVLAEGVETPSQVEFLSREGCDRMQGYHFAKPCDADALLKLLRAQESRVPTQQEPLLFAAA